MLLPAEPGSKVNCNEWEKNDESKMKLVLKEDCVGDIYDKVVQIYLE